ncbi:flagellar biosynthesis anti-sigma factor FlgM [Thermosporothrix hazakensis]|jgi:anti-sigma28 factor (negative regulator of flagellin synthesis)|nr:flagellar biosynthesis anti-sigma factor FlgM [Thermosporothrix hazakensis]BBH90932.1 hypothetical protein KTC_56830 [Thermosporothrix sp. COM3]GCE48982.1 hypothetical protein KTH_38510 [Thermosporothrix hazakensis]
MEPNVLRNQQENQPERGYSTSRRKEPFSSKGERIAAVEMRLRTQRDEQQRLERVAEIKAQVEAGTYQIDSRAIALSIFRSSTDWKLLGLDKAVALE